MAFVGILIVFGCVAGGFLMAGGHVGVLIQPSEFVVIIGAAIGTLVISAPGNMRKRVFHVLGAAFKDTMPKKQDYVDLLKLLYELFVLARRQGVLALEAHANEPAKSDLFKKYPSVMRDHHAQVFLAEMLQHLVNGVAADELEQLLDSELETLGAEGHLGTGLVKSIGDSLPGIGIVAAVLGIIVTMGHMDAPPAEIGHHVAAALVGTFLGILLCYGLLGPLASNVEFQEAHKLRYMECMKAAVLASMRGTAPATAVEFGRKLIYTEDRPTFAEIDRALQSLKGG
jgi:chemotaxis protein MotA